MDSAARLIIVCVVSLAAGYLLSSGLFAGGDAASPEAAPVSVAVIPAELTAAPPPEPVAAEPEAQLAVLEPPAPRPVYRVEPLIEPVRIPRIASRPVASASAEPVLAYGAGDAHDVSYTGSFEGSFESALAAVSEGAVNVSSQPSVDDTADSSDQPPGVASLGASVEGMLAGSRDSEVGARIQRQFAPNAPAGELSRMTWSAGESLYGAAIATPVLVAQGMAPGPTLCLTAAIHGDELNGVETVRRVMYSISPEKLIGRVIGVPIVNLQGFDRHSRYLPDRRDLNRFFPGNGRGSSAARMAFSFFKDVISGCDALVDLHTGSFHRTNLPQLRADLHNDKVVELTQGFGSTVVLHSDAGTGTLRQAAVAAGIPAVTLEAGEPLRMDDDAVEHSVKALFSLMDRLGMYNKHSLWGNPEPRYYNSTWVRADKGGMLLGEVKLGKRVQAGDVLGTVTDPFTNEQQIIVSPYEGRVIGMAINQFVMPGYAAFHLGTQEAGLDELPEELPLEEAFTNGHSFADGDLPDAGRDLAD